MNFALFRSTLRANWWLLLIFTAVSVGYLLLILGIYDEENMQFIEASVKALPPGLSAAVGMDTVPTSLTDFAAEYFYAFLIQLFLTLHLTILPIRLVVSYVDRGTMSYLLSTPNSRAKVIGTQAVYLVVSLAAMATILTSVAMAFSAAVHPGQLDLMAFLNLNFAAFLLSVALGAITFFFSCTFNEAKTVIGVSAAILVGFFVISVIARLGHGEGVYGIIDRFSIYYLLRSRDIINGEVNLWLNNALLLLIAATGIGGGILVFSRRDLPL
ncbi:ABC transporter permease subunit [candidate division KSB1 bacterium]